MKGLARRLRTRGSSFIEILIALTILAIMMVGILQMFSLALLTNNGSAARTELLYRAQQVVENLRLIYYFEAQGQPALRVAAGVTPYTGLAVPALAGTRFYLPYVTGEVTAQGLKWDYWGPDNFNVVPATLLPYRLSYTIEDRTPEPFWLVTVTATPIDNPRLTLPAVENDARHFLGSNSKVKIVTYAAQIPKAGP
jgi:hypothetical protein